MFLPTPEFSKTFGEPFEYQMFMQNFETQVEPRISDQRALFTILTSLHLNIFQCILSNDQQISSDLLSISIGAPPVSVFGPFLFLACI